MILSKRRHKQKIQSTMPTEMELLSTFRKFLAFIPYPLQKQVTILRQFGRAVAAPRPRYVTSHPDATDRRVDCADSRQHKEPLRPMSYSGGGTMRKAGTVPGTGSPAGARDPRHGHKSRFPSPGPGRLDRRSQRRAHRQAQPGPGRFAPCLRAESKLGTGCRRS